MTTTKPEISIIIPAYNEATYIGRLLEALTQQSHASFEVIVSDAESKDHTKDVIKQYQKKLDLKLVQSPPKGPANGRNKGAAQASGEWLLFLDADDDIDDPDFIGTLISGAEQKGWQTASTKMKVHGASLLERYGTWFNYNYTRMLAHTKHPVAPGWCILTRRSLFDSLNGFNEKIHFGEDYDYVSRAGKSGFGFVTNTFYYLDLRRFREEGIRFAIKGFLNEVYRHTHGYNLENNPYKYEFGKHKLRK